MYIYKPSRKLHNGIASNMVYFLYKTNACFKITSKQIGFLQKIMDSLNVMP